MIGIPQLATGLLLFFLGCFVLAVLISFGLVFVLPTAVLGYGGWRFYKWYSIKSGNDRIDETLLSPTVLQTQFRSKLANADVPEDAQRDALNYPLLVHRAAADELRRALSTDLRRKDATFKLRRSWLVEYQHEAQAVALITTRLMDQMCTLLARAYPPLPDGIIHPEEIYTDPVKTMKSAVGELVANAGSEQVTALYSALVSPEEMCRACHFDGRLGAARLDLNKDVRFEHQWVVAPSGSGKTTLLQTQIVGDLERVARGECSIIVIDSQNQLIPKIAQLRLFAPGEPLDGRLVVIEPDPEYPPALNVLDIGLSQLTIRDRYRMQAEALENVKSCLATMADTQDDMLSYIVELCFAIPGATIQTIVDILKPNGLDAYRGYLDEVDQTCRDYFETSFTPRSQSTNVTKEALTRRLMGMLRNPTFRRMFLNERGKFNMAKELEKPKVILINTDLEFLRHDACQLFGRFFIAQLLQAAEVRGERSLPVFCYIDECQDYIAADDNAAKLMDKARKRKVGMIFAHQRMQQIESANVRDALANVGVRFAGGNETDAQYLSRIFRCGPEFIANKTRGTFACYVRRQTEQATEVYVPADTLERMERMTETEYEQIRMEMRARYAAPAEPPTPRTPAREPEPPRNPPPPANDPAPPPAPDKPAAAGRMPASRARRAKPKNPDASDRTQPVGDWEP